MQSSGANPPRLGSAGLFGVFLGLAGALLDFYSGYQILTASAMMTNEMGMTVTQYTPSGLAWGVGLSALGVMLLVTAIATVTSLGMRHMKSIGALMILYGVIMLVIGVSMYSEVAPMMGGAALSGPGMLVVGALMVVNGAVMRRPPRMTMGP